MDFLGTCREKTGIEGADMTIYMIVQALLWNGQERLHMINSLFARPQVRVLFAELYSSCYISFGDDNYLFESLVSPHI